MTYRPRSDNRTPRGFKAAFRNLPIVLRQFVKKYLASWIFPAVFVIDGFIISLARIFPLRTQARSVVFVRTDNLGDFVLWLPAAKAIRAKWPWPGCRYILIANHNWSRFAEELGLFDSVIPLNRVRFQRNPFYRIAMIFRLARIKAELLVTPIQSRDPTTADTIARAINSERKIASAGDSNNAYVNPSIPSHWYNELIPSSSNSTHESVRNKEFTESLTDIKVGDPWPQFVIPSPKQLPDAIKDQDYAVIAPGASSPQRLWPSEYFSRLANKLSSEMFLGTVLIGTASERLETAAVAHGCSGPLVDLTARLSINDLLAILGHAKLVVTNETGTAHLAAALRVPTLCIMGGGHFGRFLPYPKEARDSGIKVVALHHPMLCFNCNWKCVYPIGYTDPAPCVSSVSVDAAWSAIKRLATHRPQSNEDRQKTPFD